MKIMGFTVHTTIGQTFWTPFPISPMQAILVPRYTLQNDIKIVDVKGLETGHMHMSSTFRDELSVLPLIGATSLGGKKVSTTALVQFTEKQSKKILWDCSELEFLH